MPAISRVGDVGSHGGSDAGVITSGLASELTNGIATAYVGSGYNCSEHGATTIISSPITTVTVGGNVVAMVGSVCACGATITQGSPNCTV